MSTLPCRTDVVIVGAGPTGLALGCVLAAEGVDFILLDRLAVGANTSRAAVIHARTLEVLDSLQVTEKLHALGHVVSRFTMRDRDRALATIRFDALPTRYPHTLMIRSKSPRPSLNRACASWVMSCRVRTRSPI